MATALATNIPSVAPVTNPIAQHHQLGISFHQAIRRLVSEVQFLHKRAFATCRAIGISYTAKDRAINAGHTFQSPGCAGRPCRQNLRGVKFSGCVPR